MRFFNKRKNRIIFVVVVVSILVFLIPPLILKIYFNSSLFKEKFSAEINKRFKFQDLSFKYQIGEIGLFSGVEFNNIDIKDKSKNVIELQNCYLSGIYNKAIFGKNKFNLKCGRGSFDIAYFENFKTSSDKYVKDRPKTKDYDISLKIENCEIIYKKYKAEFTLMAKYSNREKYVDIELRDRYRIHIYDINIPEKSAKLSFKNIDIPFLLDRYIGRYSNLINGRLEGSLLVKKNNQEINAEFTDISVINMSISNPLIGESPFKINKFSINGRASLSLVSGLLRFDEIDVNISDIKLIISGRFYKGSYSLKLNTKSAQLNDIAYFFGGEEFEGFDMKGEIRLNLELSGNINENKKIDKVNISGDVYKPVQLSQRLNYLKSDFSYDFTGKNGKKRKIVVGTKNPDYVPFSEIPRYVYGAVVSSEDAGFFGHKGVEFKEIESAIIDNIESDKPYLRGGSTISQQLVKNLFLSREKTLLRKMKELLLSVELDAALSKERILEIYINGIEWGPEIFGIGAATRHYFGKAASELKPIEAAYLASIIPNPNRYYVYFVKDEIPDKWMEKIQNILYKMNLFGFLPDDEYNKSLSEKIIFEHIK